MAALFMLGVYNLFQTPLAILGIYGFASMLSAAISYSSPLKRGISSTPPVPMGRDCGSIHISNIHRLARIRSPNAHLGRRQARWIQAMLQAPVEVYSNPQNLAGNLNHPEFYRCGRQRGRRGYGSTRDMHHVGRPLQSVFSFAHNALVGVGQDHLGL